MAQRMTFDYTLGTAPARDARRADPQRPMRILVMGDFSARSHRGADDAADLAKRRAMPLDIDSFDRVLARIAPRLDLGAGAVPATRIDITSLDDFHPDGLYARLPLFDALRDLRQRMQNPATFDAAAAAFSADAQQARGRDTQPQADPNSTGSVAEGDRATLDRLLGGSASAVSRSGAAPAVSGIDALIRDAVAPHIVPDAPPHQAQYLASVDAATCEQMNALLHSPAFQDLEALWRGVYRLVANLELGEELQLYVLDVTKRELLQDLAGAQTDLASSAVYRLLVDEASGTPGSEPWSLIAGHYDFGRGGEDVALLAALGAIGSHAGAPFLAAAKPEIAGCTTFAAAPDPGDWDDASGDDAQAWNSLRASAMAPWIGLAAPRMLLRLPYGKNAERIDAFEFDELGVNRQHEHYLWGNPALACVLLIGRAFAARGWDMAPGDELDVDDLPAHTFEADGEKHLQPCAEVLITERAGQALLERGVMPLLSYKNRDAVRVLRFQSIAEPSRALSGPWS